ncbi:MAG TPA: fasciclin domain-containing protein [Nevskiaceae bacterium]|nr:fasciclin domain-containing protein [Nevskiaceae bacterium]
MRTLSLSATLVSALLLSAPALAGHHEKMAAPGANPMVGKAAMLPTQTIVANAANSPVHTTLVAAVKAAGLVETLQGPGPFTVFAPVNDAFENLPAGTVDTLLKPENKATLTGVLTYHVVAGKLDAAAVKAAIAKGGGKAVVKTVAGGSLTLSLNGPANVVVTDEKGGVANIVTYDVNQSNGVIHVIDAVLLPK